ncbi:hypothetical protein K9K77_01125 [Candidatus Babeliales bacterium]|nr:hypothetical protein [Candidatus Babeliales bacterium]
MNKNYFCLFALFSSLCCSSLYSAENDASDLSDASYAHISTPPFIFMNPGLLDSLEGKLKEQGNSEHVYGYGVESYDCSLKKFVSGILPFSLKTYSTPQELISYLKTIGIEPSLWSKGNKEVRVAIVREIVREGVMYSDHYVRDIIFTLNPANNEIMARF